MSLSYNFQDWTQGSLVLFTDCLIQRRNMGLDKSARMAGFFILIGMVAGIFSVAPSIDTTQYLTEAVRHPNQVIGASVFQALMSLCYIAVAMLLYPIAAKYGKVLAIGFLSLRVVAVCLSIVGTILLLCLLGLSESFAQSDPKDFSSLESLGAVLKLARDSVNHVFMVLMLCIGNTMLYTLLIKNKLIPSWLSLWGIAGALLSVIASFLVLFRVLDVITSEYIAMNVPTAVFELVFGFWLILKGIPKSRPES